MKRHIFTNTEIIEIPEQYKIRSTKEVVIKDDSDRIIKSSWLLTYEEKCELLSSNNRRCSSSWSTFRQCFNEDINERLQLKLEAMTKKERDSIPLSESLREAIRTLGRIGYSAKSIAQAAKYSVSVSHISTILQELWLEYDYSRDTIIELCDIITDDVIQSWKRKYSVIRRGPGSCEQYNESELKPILRDYWLKGYNNIEVMKILNVSKNIVLKYYKVFEYEEIREGVRYYETH